MCSYSFLILFVAAVSVECAYPLVTIDQGTLEGDTGKALNGDVFFKFLGIPFAKSPVGELRFKAPVNPEPWEGIRNARQEGHFCKTNDEDVNGSEDCLYANVFTRELQPENNTAPLKSVMIFIYGGGFTAGSSALHVYGPEYLLSKVIVLVTFNYRAGILGFLSLEDTTLDVPGNAGLKDQRMVLQWVQKNIAKFGGDPKRVTIFGGSAGAASVHYHVFSPSSKDLFHRAIMESGNALNPWARGSKNAIQVAKYLGKNVTTEAEALKILMKATANELNAAQMQLVDNVLDVSRIRPFSPVIEKPNDSAFITKEPKEIIASGEYNRVPLIMGFNTKEGFMAYNNSEVLNEKYLSKCIPWTIGTKPETTNQIIEGMKKTYLRDGIDGMYDVFTDVMFLYGITEFARNHSKFADSPVYFYEVTVQTKLNWKNITYDLPGVPHGGELAYIFKASGAPDDFENDSKEAKTIEEFLTLWTNFAIYGNPTPNSELGIIWKPVSGPERVNFLEIGDQLKMNENPCKSRMELWRNVDYGTAITAAH